ncbi:MAG: helix-turn-helix domain-containing protein [Beijerinckiaceae bacterium]
MVDVHVGARLRKKRILEGLSQEKLGETLGVTFQQIQKYEKGVNRIGPSRLQTAARLFGVPVNFFFEDSSLQLEKAPGFLEGPGPGYVSDAEAVQIERLTQAFSQIKHEAMRQRLVELAEAMAGKPLS